MSDIRIKMAKDLRDMSDMVGDLHWMAAKAIEDLTKKEGEIAKRDAQIVELESAAESLIISRDYHHEQEIEYRRRWAGLCAAPVSEAKAKGVVQWPDADEIMQMAFEEGQPADDASGYCFELEEFDLFIERLMSEVARLNASLVQQASVPDERANFESEYLKANYPRVHSGELSAPPIFGQTGKGEYEDDDMQKCWVMWQARAMLAAAPAAPAADAGLVWALERIAGNAASHIEQGKRPDLVTVSHWAGVAYSAIDAHRTQGVV